jgi:hypothetical protein
MMELTLEQAKVVTKKLRDAPQLMRAVMIVDLALWLRGDLAPYGWLEDVRLAGPAAA